MKNFFLYSIKCEDVDNRSLKKTFPIFSVFIEQKQKKKLIYYLEYIVFDSYEIE